MLIIYAVRNPLYRTSSMYRAGTIIPSKETESNVTTTKLKSALQSASEGRVTCPGRLSRCFIAVSIAMLCFTACNSPSPTQSTTPTHPAAAFKEGVTYDTQSPGDTGTFAAWLGAPQSGANYDGSTTWAGWENPVWCLGQWASYEQSHPGSAVQMSVNPFPFDSNNNPLGTVAAGAAGSYNSYWKALTENIVASGFQHVILRPMWEFNGSWDPWGTTSNPSQFIQYWQNIVNTVRSVPGSGVIKFFWCADLDITALNPEPFWPGATYVDYIGFDVYDVDWSGANYYHAGLQPTSSQQAAFWQSLVSQTYGLSYFASLAQQKGLPMIIGEWAAWGVNQSGIAGGGDDPLFIQNMYNWFAANNVAYEFYFNDGTAASDPATGNHQIYPTTDLPQSQAMFKSLFGNGGGSG